MLIFPILIDQELEKIHIENLPGSENYEKSYMHRDTITHLVVTM